MRNVNAIALLLVSLTFASCDRAPKEQPAQAPASAASSATPAATSAPQPAAAPAAAPATPAPATTAKPGHSGESIELGTVEVAGHSIRASRDKGAITAGADSPVDVWINESSGKDVTVVRLWIGTADAKGSLKVKADLEDGHWHTHVEVPDPLPAQSKLWVEFEAKDQQKQTASFDLKI